MRRTISMTIAALVGITLLVGCAATTVKPGFKALKFKKYRDGLVKDKVYDNGVVWQWRWDDAILYNTQWKTYGEHFKLFARNDLHVEIDASVILRPVEREIVELELEVGNSYYEKLVKPEFHTVMRAVIATYDHIDVPKSTAEIEAKVLEILRKRLAGKHIEFDDVTLGHVMYSHLILNAQDEKLAKKEELEQKEYEKRIEHELAEIKRIRAKGDADAEIIQAKGRSESQIIEANAQKEAQEKINISLTDKYLKFKALEAHEQFSRSPNTKYYFTPIGKNGVPLILETK